MQLFNAKIRLSNSVINEVRKAELTAPEIIVLTQEHGEGSVVEIERTKEVARDNTEERERLEGLYGEKKIAELFGAKFNTLPKTIPGVNEAALPSASMERVSGKQVAKAREMAA